MVQLSVIIPSFNEEKYLPKLLQSLKLQTFKDFEIIVADKHSSDQTKSIAEAAGCIVVQGGIPAQGRSCGAAVASGKIFFFVDADCVLDKYFLADAITQMNRRTLQVAGCVIYPYNGSRFVDNMYFGLFNFWMRFTQRWSPHAAGAAIFCAADVYRKSGGFNGKVVLFEEHDFVKRAAKHGKFRMLRNVHVDTSVRRFEQQGRLKVFFQLLISGVYRLLFGEITKDTFRYRYDYRK